MKIGNRIKTERKKRNISQQQLADYLNISRQAVSRWENDISLPDLNTLFLIAKYFDLTLDHFTEDSSIERSEESDKEVGEKNIRDRAIEEATPYIIVLTVIITMIVLLPSKVGVPILFFGSIIVIFFVSCLLIYYIIKNYLSRE
ncbi:hypothetical protein BAU15_07220 [Enterococcus sp. JM4C]|uniref:helix-turn-helix domain-containing protein n=1 Tax=Candidatus Enterococcus huntleyi TaxID=1857217 RepID=UPI00137A4678|nr:helix-turn-helix transcriptional regulator [Enterococcus sp. JM4C]KAF1297498.1 hypothetical protein BAU15_07220 [Enterococcus sp. JM4C]